MLTSVEVCVPRTSVMVVVWGFIPGEVVGSGSGEVK